MTPRAPGLACALLAAVLLPEAAQASFGGTPCRADFGCHFFIWGLLLGAVWGIPGSGVLFAVLHLVFCHPARSKLRQAIAGGAIGMVAFEIAAAAASLMASWDRNPWMGLFPSLAVLAVASVLYARSSPRQQVSG